MKALFWSFEEKGNLSEALAKIIIEIFLLSNKCETKVDDICLDDQIKEIHDVYSNFVDSGRDKKRLGFLVKFIRKLCKPTANLIKLVLKFVDLTNIKNLKDLLYNNDGMFFTQFQLDF